jgi:hypothetical protein
MTTTRISDRLQTRLNNTTNKAERAYLLGLLVTARNSETKANRAAHVADGRTRPRMVDDTDVAADSREAAAEETAHSRILVVTS